MCDVDPEGEQSGGGGAAQRITPSQLRKAIGSRQVLSARWGRSLWGNNGTKSPEMKTNPRFVKSGISVRSSFGDHVSKPLALLRH